MNQKEGRRIPDMLCIGHLCHDRHGTGHLLGGTASYASLMSAHLGMDTALLTSVGQDFKFWEELKKDNLVIENVSVRQTTEFENVYDGDKRTQYIHARANVIGVDHVPENWLNIQTVKLCLIADEVSSELIRSFPNAFKAASIQGWLRQWEDSGLVFPKPLDLQRLDGLDMVFLSEDDIDGDMELLDQMKERVETIVMTKGSKPAKIYRAKTELEFPVYPVKEVDPTGAGDIFAISFLMQYRRTESIVLSAAYAHSAASYVVEHVGVYLPSAEDIELRYASYIDQFIS